MKPEISFDDFVKLDIRVGTITSAEEVPKSNKLLKFNVYFGEEIGNRTILSGIKGSYDVTQMQGLQVVAIVNLPPRKMMSIESHGMLLAGKWTDGRINLVSCGGCENGTEIG